MSNHFIWQPIKNTKVHRNIFRPYIVEVSFSASFKTRACGIGSFISEWILSFTVYITSPKHDQQKSNSQSCSRQILLQSKPTETTSVISITSNGTIQTFWHSEVSAVNRRKVWKIQKAAFALGRNQNWKQMSCYLWDFEIADKFQCRLL